MVEYLSGCLIAFTALNAVLIIFNEPLKRYERGIKLKKSELRVRSKRRVLNRVLLCLVPVLRELFIASLILFALLPDEIADEILEALNKKQQ